MRIQTDITRLDDIRLFLIGSVAEWRNLRAEVVGVLDNEIILQMASMVEISTPPDRDYTKLGITPTNFRIPNDESIACNTIYVYWDGQTPFIGYSAPVGHWIVIQKHVPFLRDMIREAFSSVGLTFHSN